MDNLHAMEIPEVEMACLQQIHEDIGLLWCMLGNISRHGYDPTSIEIIMNALLDETRMHRSLIESRFAKIH